MTLIQTALKAIFALNFQSRNAWTDRYSNLFTITAFGTDFERVI